MNFQEKCQEVKNVHLILINLYNLKMLFILTLFHGV